MKTQLTALSLALLFPGLAALGASAATAQTELFFATGVDSTGWAQAQSNADGHVLIESPQYPRGLWLHLVDEAGDALAGLQVEYQGQPDSLVEIRCVDPAGGVQETLVWTQPDGTPLSLTLKPKKAADLPAGLASIDWQIDSGTIYLLKPVEKARLGWEGLAAFMRKRWQGQAGRVAVQLDEEISLAVEVDHPEAAETIVAYLQQLYQSAGDTFVESTALKLQVFKGSLTLLEGVILFISYFEDAVLEVVVRRELRRPRGPITRQKISSLTNFEASSKGIHSLSGLEHFTALQRLELYDNLIADITPLAQLENLNTLWLGNNKIKDLSPLVTNFGLSEGDVVDLYNNSLSDQALTEQIPALQARGVRVSY